MAQKRADLHLFCFMGTQGLVGFIMFDIDVLANGYSSHEKASGASFQFAHRLGLGEQPAPSRRLAFVVSWSSVMPNPVHEAPVISQ